MAISLAVDPSIAPCFSSSSSSSSSSSTVKTLKPRNLILRSIHPRPSFSSKPILGFQSLCLSPISTNSRHSFIAPLSAQQSNDGEEEKSEDPADVEALIRVYQEALSNGDEGVVSEIESSLCRIEEEKNKLDQRILSLSMEISSWKERYIRLQADFENFRKRHEKDRLITESNAREEVMKSLLPLVDSFERARQQMKPDTEKEKKINTSYQGIYRQFVEVLRSLRVSAIGTVGKPFDPLLHEAISREESHELKEGIVTQELNRGFVLGDRVLRQAKVKVSSRPGHKKTPSATGQSTGADER